MEQRIFKMKNAKIREENGKSILRDIFLFLTQPMKFVTAGLRK